MTTRREELFASGVQFGHQTYTWCPKMSRYLWGEKDGIHLINIAITEQQIANAEKVLEDAAQKGLAILWVGTKRVARESIIKAATETTSPYFAARWIGGTLTNYAEIKKAVTNMLYNKEMLEKADRQMYTKKELSILQKKIERAEKSVGGIERLGQRPGAIVIVGVKEERVALKEAERMGIPVIALVDTNCDPTGISLVIPANDDRESSISLILGYLSAAVKRGKEVYLQNNPIVAAEEREATEKRGNFKKQHGRGNRSSNQTAAPAPHAATEDGQKPARTPHHDRPQNNRPRRENTGERSSEGRERRTDDRTPRSTDNREARPPRRPSSEGAPRQADGNKPPHAPRPPRPAGEYKPKPAGENKPRTGSITSSAEGTASAAKTEAAPRREQAPRPARKKPDSEDTNK